MNHIALALDGYEEINAKLRAERSNTVADAVERWLTDEVCAACNELFRNSQFQLLARWSVDRLEPGVTADERQFVLQVDAALVDLARALSTHETTSSTERASTTPSMKYISMEDGRAVCAWIAARPWYDLVSSEEYFDPHRGLHLNCPYTDQLLGVLHNDCFRQGREWNVPLGDYVQRMLFARIRYFSRLLTAHYRASATVLNGTYAQSRPLLDAWFSLHAAVKQLEQACCRSPDKDLRDAACTLVQVYCAYAPSPELPWLGCGLLKGVGGEIVRKLIQKQTEVYTQHSLTSERIHRGTVNFCNAEILRGIARALHTARSFREAPHDPDDYIEWYRNRVQLLIVDRQNRQVFFDGEEVASGKWDLNANLFNLLWVLAANPRRVVDVHMLQNPDGDKIASRRNRLGNLLAGSELDGLIDTERGRGYRLSLDRKSIGRLHDDGTGKIIEG